MIKQTVHWDAITSNFQQSYLTVSYEVFKATSIKYMHTFGNKKMIKEALCRENTQK